jgi:hypothetical protein
VGLVDCAAITQIAANTSQQLLMISMANEYASMDSWFDEVTRLFFFASPLAQGERT